MVRGSGRGSDGTAEYKYLGTRRGGGEGSAGRRRTAPEIAPNPEVSPVNRSFGEIYED